MMQKIKSVFFPALLLTILLSLSSSFFKAAQMTLIHQQLIQVTQIPFLKTVVLVPYLLLVLTLFFLSNKPFEKIFQNTLWTLIGIISFAACLLPFQPAFFYVLADLLTPTLFSVLIWGFINRVTDLSEGIKTYLPLAFILGFSAYLPPTSWSLQILIPSGIALLLTALVLFRWTWKKLSPSEISEKTTSSFPFISAAYLLAGCTAIQQILTFFFKHQLKIQLNPANYQTTLAYFSWIAASTALIASVLWLILGTHLLQKKGWRPVALSGSLLLLIGGIAFFSMPPSSLTQGIYTGLLMGTKTTLFFALIQILYLQLPAQNRFRAKWATEMLALPLIEAGISFVSIQGLLIQFGSFSAIPAHLPILIPLVLLILLVIASRKAGRWIIN